MALKLLSGIFNSCPLLMLQRSISTQYIGQEWGKRAMSESVRTTVKCQDPDDGSEDVIIDLPPEILAALNVDLGDLLSIELVEGSIVIKPIRDANTES